MALVTAPSISRTAETRSADAIGVGLERASKCGIYGLIVGGILLSPVFGFLMALVVDILIGLLKDGGIPALLALVSAGAIGGFLFRKLWPRPQDSASDWT
jgi:Na+-driven multidrug efflux pump